MGCGHSPVTLKLLDQCLNAQPSCVLLFQMDFVILYTFVNISTGLSGIV